jgi:hypothetical protein
MYNVHRKDISKKKEQVRSNSPSVPAHWEMPERSHPEIFHSANFRIFRHNQPIECFKAIFVAPRGRRLGELKNTTK